MAAKHPRRSSRTEHWSREEVAEALVSDRDVLVAQLPRELASARGMTQDQRELVVDEAIDFLVTEYASPIHDREHLDRAFWTAAGLRVRRVHEGRGATVRAGWKRVDVDDVDIAASEGDPATAVIHRLEVGVLLEFAATLSEVQRRVLACKYGGKREIGRRLIARELAMPMTEVRNAERAIAKRLKAFVAIVAAGTLCEERGGSIADLATGRIDGPSAAAARIHLEHCPACRVGYVELVRSLKTGDLQHRIAQLLPISITVEEGRRQRGGPWEALSDWLSRPFASESTSTGVQLVAGTRGIGAVAAAKLASLCIGGAVVLGGATYCVTTVISDEPPEPAAKAQPAPPKTASGPKETLRPSAGQRVFRVAKKPVTKKTRATASTRQTETAHEQSAAVSPPATTNTGAPVAEFGPGPSTTAPPAPAAAPATGAPEFP